ncbi:MAG: ATP-dependent metallopeptidase FtsH/Yme1/Tma family protein [Candidatus Wallbacteria bacterium]|nr:ATP-dependent metallopeptidase FtsH/Yme1/Tma family protein [Candidatus Wallbacteria bacterium]
MGNRFKNYTLYLLILVIIFAIFAHTVDKQPEQLVGYSEFWQKVGQGQVYELTMDGKSVRYKTLEDKGKRIFRAYWSPDDGDLRILRETKISGVDPDNAKRPLDRIKVTFEPPTEIPWWLSMLGSWFPFVVLILIWFYFLQKMQGGGAKALSFGKSRARFMDSSRVKNTFDDVAGCDEAKSDLEEVIEFLKHPKKFKEIGARLPRGVLLMGPPGTGKTLLARAVAGEANVPFLHISGSDFVEMFVGVGASRVRDLFEQGKKHAPCLIFIDEIDAVGRQRGAGLGGGHDEREQTLNQLLVEMDGFDTNEGVIMIAATNRPDVLDPALLRPGRFDRQIVVDLPDIKGREAIFRIHGRKVPVTDEVDMTILARATPGFSGADIANMVNEAALLCARRNRKLVVMRDFEDARDKLLMGPERKSRVLTDAIKQKTAWHEAGHALMTKVLKSVDELHKVSIIPRGRALGVTSFLPEEEKLYLRGRHYLLDTICAALGGRVAEELRFSEIDSGAANDIEKATKIAHQMICEFGMSDRLGPISYGEKNSLIFLGRDLTRDRNYSEQTSREIDEELKRIIMEALERTRKLLKENYDKLQLIAENLLIHEVLDNAQIDRLLAGETLPPPLSPAAKAEMDRPKPRASEGVAAEPAAAQASLEPHKAGA